MMRGGRGRGSTTKDGGRGEAGMSASRMRALGEFGRTTSRKMDELGSKPRSDDFMVAATSWPWAHT